MKRMQINFKNINKEMYTKTTIELLQKYRSYYESVFKKNFGRDYLLILFYMVCNKLKSSMRKQKKIL